MTKEDKQFYREVGIEVDPSEERREKRDYKGLREGKIPIPVVRDMEEMNEVAIQRIRREHATSLAGIRRTHAAAIVTMQDILDGANSNIRGANKAIAEKNRRIDYLYMAVAFLMSCVAALLYAGRHGG